MRYVIEYLIIFAERKYPMLVKVLGKYGIAVPGKARILPEGQLRIQFEKSDPRLHEVAEALRAADLDPVESFQPAFEPWEVEQAELVCLRVHGYCGEAFEETAARLSLPSGTRVMDKRAMGRVDIAKTYAWKEIVVSERVREILASEGLTGWATEPIQHHNPKRDPFPPLYELLATNELPPLAPETELHYQKRDNDSEGLPSDGMPVLYEQGPLCYRRRDLRQVADVNRTREVFLEPTVAHPYFIFSKRAREALVKHRVRGDILWEPIVILE